MKKSITLLLCLSMVLALTMTTLVGCNNLGSQATAIEVVNPTTEYFVNDTINYDELQVKITYEDGTTKEGTLSKLKVTVSKEADLSKEGETSYTIALGALTFTVDITVTKAPELVTAFSMPKFYVNYLTASKDREEGAEEKRGDFRVTGEAYEVGNVNKFIFRPTAVALDDNDNAVTISNAKTTAKVYEKATLDSEYVLVQESDLEGIVTIENNTYKFTEEAAGKYYKVEVTLDGEEYSLSGMKEEDCTVEFECLVVDGGYNVYDQIGLSVMNDLGSSHWTDIWNCNIDANYVLSAKEDSLKLEADDKPLCEYVGNIDWVILHTSFELDADLLPDYYFWTEETEGYQTAYNELTGHAELQQKLVGSLRDGVGNGIQFRVMNVDGNGYAAQTGIGVNMQKAFYSTYKVSVSGNYNSITTPTEASEGGRNLYAVLDYSDDGDRVNPTPHWQIMQMHQSKIEGQAREFTLKNLAMTGNCGQQDTSNVVPAGLIMLNCYGTGVNIENLVGNSFYTNVTCDAYGETRFNADYVKLYNAYSNMFYLWRAKVNLTECDFIGSGGPLFILCDGNPTDPARTDEAGPNLTVDDKSVLQAFATGDESWYKLYNAQPLVANIKTMDGAIFNNVYKTIRFTKDSNGNAVPYTKNSTGLEYVNVIAAIICEPGDLLAGLNTGMQYVCGSYKTVNAQGDVIDNFSMNNLYVKSLRAAVQNDGRKFAPIFQTGNLFMYTDMTNLYTLGAQGPQAFNPQTDGLAWATNTNKTLGIYMSAGSMSQSANAPYFGVILASSQYAK